MGRDVAEIRGEFQTRLNQIARELTGELYPRGLPRGTKFSELEAVAGALGVQLGGLNYYRGVPSAKPTLGDAVVPLQRSIFGPVRVLLYTTEGLCVALILGCSEWR